MKRGMTLIEVLLALSLLVAVLGASTTLLAGLARDRQAVVEHVERLRTLDLALDQIDAAFATVAVRAGKGPGLRITDTSITVWPAMERPGIDTTVPGRHSMTLQHDGVGITLKAADGAGVVMPGLSSMRVRARYGGQWLNAFDAAAEGALPDLVVIDAWLIADPDEETLPDRRRVLVVIDGVDEL